MGKEEADGLKKVSVQFLKKHGYFSNGWRSGTLNFSRNGFQTGSIGIQVFVDENEKYIKFIYTQTNNYSGEKTDLDYKIPLTSTPCYFGGKRYWFVCPFYSRGVYCGKRVGVLYLSDKYFACRHCNDLTYNSRNLSGIFKTAGQVISEPDLDKLRDEIKREHYAGKMTRKFRSYLKKQRKALFQMQAVVMGMDKVYKRRS